MRAAGLLACAGALLAAGCTRDAAAKPPVRVAAAADLATAFEALAPGFQQQTGLELAFSFGATGALARQLEQSAPFDVFAAADQSFVAPLLASGICDPASASEYARGSLVAFAREGVPAPRTVDGLADLRYRRIAIANPEHAPYGRAAKEALQQAGLWSAVEGRLVVAENVRAALQFAQSGNVDLSLVSRSLVAGVDPSRFLSLDPGLHAPLVQTVAVCLKGKNPAGGRAFAAYLLGPKGRAVLEQHGLPAPADAGVPR